MGDSLQQDSNSDEFTLLSMPVEAGVNFRGLNDHLVDSATFDLSSDELASKFREILKENMDLKDMARQLNAQLKFQADYFNILKEQVRETAQQHTQYNSMIQDAKVKLVEVVEENKALKMKITKLEQEKKHCETEFCEISAQMRQKLTETEKNLEKSQKENQRFHVVHLQMKEELNSVQLDWDKLKSKYDDVQQQITQKSLPNNCQAEVRDKMGPDKELLQKVKRLEVQIKKLESEKQSALDASRNQSIPTPNHCDDSLQEFNAKLQSALRFLDNYMEGCKTMQSWIVTCHSRLENLPPRDDVTDQLLYETCSLKYRLNEEMDRRNSEKLQLTELDRFIETALKSKGISNASPRKAEDGREEANAVKLKQLQELCDTTKSLLDVAENELQSKTVELSNANALVEVLQSQITVLRREFSEEKQKFEQMSQDLDHNSITQEPFGIRRFGHHAQRAGRNSGQSDRSSGSNSWGRPNSVPNDADSAFNVAYRCPKCDFTFKGLHALNNHMDNCLSIDDPFSS